MDKGDYQLVPYRFFLSDSNTDTCRLEKLTNLFPDMKTIIELELFKIKNLTPMINRLSKIYSVSTAINIRDDTLHVFLGPYHLALGPAIFGALQFKNVSKELLASKQSKKTNENLSQSQTRRHEAALRRFRRAVRKLILIKSIIDQIRLASILTPYNQYELYNQGIYDLVLSGHIHNSPAIFNEDHFSEEIKSFSLMNNSEKETSLLASKFVKVNALLQLLSPISQQNNTTTTTTIPMQSNDTNPNISNGDSKKKSALDSAGICCPQHCDNLPPIVFPINRSYARQSNHLLPHESDSHRNRRKRSSIRSQPKTTSSLPDLTADNSIEPNPPSSTVVTSLNPVVSDKPKDTIALRSDKPSSRLSTKLEDAVVNRISSLLTSYFLSQQSTPISFDPNDSLVPLSSMTTKTLSNDSDISIQSSSIAETNDFDRLLQRIKTVVDNRLSVQIQNKNPNVSSSSPKTPTNNRRRQFGTERSASFQETPADEFDGEYLKPANNRHKLLSSKSQSFDETNPNLSLAIFESDDNSISF